MYKKKPKTTSTTEKEVSPPPASDPSSEDLSVPVTCLHRVPAHILAQDFSLDCKIQRGTEGVTPT